MKQILNFNDYNENNDTLFEGSKPKYGKKATTLEKAMLEAATKGDFHVVKTLIETGLCARLDVIDQSGKNIIMCAAQGGDVNIIKYLVSQGASVDTSGKYGTPLTSAIQSGKLDMVKYFVDNGADINKLPSYGDTAFMASINNGELSLIKYLIDKGADINQKTTYGDNPLKRAVSSNRKDIVEYLISLGVDIKTDSNSYSPLYLSSSRNQHEMTIFLIQNGLRLTDGGKQYHPLNQNYNKIWDRYDVQKALMEQDPKNLHELTKHNIPIDPKISKEYPEDIISDELGFF